LRELLWLLEHRSVTHFLHIPFSASGRGFRCGRTATVARRERTSSRKRLLLGFCFGLVPLRSPQNPAGQADVRLKRAVLWRWRSAP
jgi:hypothetical protein